MKYTRAVAAMVTAMVWGVSVQAEPAANASGSAGGLGLTAKVGTLGIGGDLTIGLSDYLGLRFGVNGFAWNPSAEAEGHEIYSDIDWFTAEALLDVHPFGGGFRISGGGMLNKNKLKLRADVDEPVELNDIDFQLSDLYGEVTFNEFAPYAGIGYGNAVGADGRWHFDCDFGVMFQGKPDVSASATASDPRAQRAVDLALDKELDDIRDTADNFQFYPVISVGVSFRF
jgi:hypothetical protein